MDSNQKMDITSEEQPINNRERNYGIDLLRLVSMYYVVVLHCMGCGGLLDRHLYLSWFIEIWAFCAVNCFALISGYVGYREADHYYLNCSKYIKLWLQVVFYGVVIASVYKLLMPEKITAHYFLTALFPVANNEYWYFTAYTGLIFVTPIIHKSVHALEKKDLRRCLIVLFFAFSCYTVICRLVGNDIFFLKDGYSFVWIAMLYFCGAAFKKINPSAIPKQRWLICGVFLLTLISLLYLVFATHKGFENPDLLVVYTSPTIVLAAVFHLLFFSKLHIGKTVRRIVQFSAPGAFSIYLLNTHPCFWDLTLKNLFSYLYEKPLCMMPLTVFGFSLLFVVCSVILDRFRQLLFSHMHINAFIDRICASPDKAVKDI